jgi:hypothetical protein
MPRHRVDQWAPAAQHIVAARHFTWCSHLTSIPKSLPTLKHQYMFKRRPDSYNTLA